MDERVSTVQDIGPVAFPSFRGERFHMREFRQADGLPSDLRRWQTTVDMMLAGIRTEQAIFLTVDQAHVKAGTTHRRPGLHVDGYWDPTLRAHGGGHRGHRFDGEHEALVLASDVLGCIAYVGAYQGEPGDGGDCAHVDVSGLQRVALVPYRAWCGPTGTLLHESLIATQDHVRTFVRLNVKGWS